MVVADPQGLILDSRDYLAPLVTPWEAALALAGRHLDLADYRMDFGAVLVRGRARVLAVSVVVAVQGCLCVCKRTRGWGVGGEGGGAGICVYARVG